MSFATVTSKGQITIPKEVRKSLQLQAGDRLEFVWVGEAFHIRPISRKVENVFGKYHRSDQKTISVEAMNAAIRKRFQDQQA